MSCNGCRVLRRGCSDSCLLRSCLSVIDGSEAQGNATLFLAKFFGRAGLMGFISAVDESQRGALFQSLLYEACGRTINPVYGCAGLLWCGQWNVCEAAVHSVLSGEALKKTPSSSSMPFLSLNSSSFSAPPSNTFVPNLGFNPSVMFYPTTHNIPSIPYWTTPPTANQPVATSPLSTSNGTPKVMDNPVHLSSSKPISMLPSPMHASFPAPVVRTQPDSCYWKNGGGFSALSPSQNQSASPSSCSDSTVLKNCGLSHGRASDSNSNANSPAADSNFNNSSYNNNNVNNPISVEGCGKRRNFSNSENSCVTTAMVDTYPAPSARVAAMNASSNPSCDRSTPTAASIVAPVARRLKPNSDSTAFMSALTSKTGVNEASNAIEFHHLFPTHPGSKGGLNSFSNDFLHPSHAGDFSIALVSNHHRENTKDYWCA